MSGPVLLVVPTLGRGGAERVFVDLAGGFAAAGHDSHLAWASGTGDLASGVDDRVTTHDLGGSRTAAAVPRLRRLVSDLGPSVVLSALFHGNLLAATATRGRRDRPALVFTEHVELGPLPGAAPRRLTRWSPRLIPVVYRAADAVVAVSTGVARDLQEAARLPRSLIHQIPNPVDFDRIDLAAAATPDHPWLLERHPERPVIVAAGRLDPVKGFDLLLRAMTRLDESVRLVVLGEGPERGRLEALAAELGLGARVDLPGASANPYPELARADLVVSSSRTEALPTVLIEALHLRRPVVATDCSAGVREVLDDGAVGRLVPVGEPAALASGIAEVLARGGAAEPGAHAMARYDAPAVIGRYARLVDQLSR